MTLHLHEPYLSQPGGYGYDQTHVVARDRGSRIPHLGLWRQPLAPVVIAWIALAISGVSLALTGQLDWYGLYGERAVQAAALGAAGFVLWWQGQRSHLERIACWATFAATLVALALFPAGSRVEFYAGVWLIQVGLCFQLAAWLAEARKPQRTGLVIILIGMLADTLTLLPASQFVEVAPECQAAMMLTCIAGPAVAMALPAAVTAALIVLWLTPIEDALNVILRRSR